LEGFAGAGRRSTFPGEGRNSTIHDLEIQSVRAAFHKAYRTKPVRAVKFSTAVEDCGISLPFDRSKTPYESDAFIALGDPLDLHSHTEYFLELDRSTSSLDALVAKTVRYAEHFRTHRGSPGQGAMGHRVHVLMVFLTDERRNNATERLLQHYPPIHGRILLATLRDVLADASGHIWIRPFEYRQAMTFFGGGNRPKAGSFRYRRQRSKDKHVAQHVPKVSLPLPPANHATRAAA
jgi:hypothetical protein